MLRYTVRLAKETEIDVLPEVERAAARRFLPYLAKLEISTMSLEGLTPLRFLRRAQAEHRLWVAVPEAAAQATNKALSNSTSPVGFIVAKFLPSSCFVIELSVHPDHGRRGVGSALVEACCQGAQSRGAQRVTLTTFRQVPWNIPFYQRLGFEILSAENWSPELKAIVDHESRYGFLPQHRAVMVRLIDGTPSGKPLSAAVTTEENSHARC